MIYRQNPASLVDAVRDLPLDDLKRFASFYGEIDEPVSKARLIEELPAKIEAGLPASAIDYLSKCPHKQLAILLAIEECEGFLGEETAVLQSSHLRRMREENHPILFFGGREDHPLLFAEFFDAARSTCRDYFDTEEVLPPETSVSVPPESTPNDLLTLWCYVHKNPLKATKNGAAKKKDIENVADLFSIDEDAAPYDALFKYFGMSRLGLLLDFAGSYNLLKQRRDIITTDSAFVNTAVNGFPDYLRRLLVHVSGMGNPITAVTSYILKRTDGWLRLNDIIRLTKNLGVDDSGVYTRYVVFTLFISGCLAAGRRGKEVLVQTLSDYGEPGEGPVWDDYPDLLIGSNFDVKVPSNAAPRIRLKVEAFADIQTPGVYYDYLITKVSIYRALDDGITGGDIIAFLEENSRRGVPQNVRFAVENWERRFHDVGFESGLFLSAADLTTIRELANLAEITENKGDYSQLYVIKIPDNRYDAIKDYLLDMGYLPRSLPRSVKGRPGSGDVSVLFSGVTKSVDRGLTEAPRESTLKRAVEFACIQGRAITLTYPDGTVISGLVTNLAFGKKPPSAVIEDEDGAHVVRLRDIVDFKLD